jgi:HSP20 family protein
MAKKESIKDKLSIKPKKENVKITERKPQTYWTDIDQMFDRFKSDLDNLFLTPFRETSVGLTEFKTPSTDIADHGDKYEVCAEMPGVNKDNINIEVTQNSIEISAETQETEEEENKDWLRRERNSMSYYRNFGLPEDIKSDNVEAEFRDGILTVMLPKVKPKQRPKPKKINVK